MRALKYIVWGLLLIVLATAVTAAVTARIYMTPEHIMRSLQTALAIHLHAHITCADIEVRPMSGFTLKDVRIYDSLSPVGEPLLRCAEVRLTHSLLPLFLKKLLIRDITVHDPVIIPTFLRERSRDYSALPDLRPPLQVLVLPRSLQISGGQIQLTTAAGPFGLEDISIEARRIALISDSPVTLSAGITGDRRAEVHGIGTLSIPGRSLTLELTCNQISLARFSRQLHALGVPLTSGTLSVELTVASDLDQARTQVRAELADATLNVPVAPLMTEPGSALMMESLHGAVDIDAVWDMARRTFDITDISGKLLSAPFSGNASVRQTGSHSHFRSRLRIPAVNLDELFAHCTQLPAQVPEHLRLGGPLEVRMHATGKLDEFAPVFLFQFRDNPVLLPGLGSLQPRISGTIGVDPDRISLDGVTIGMQDLWVSLAGDVRDYATPDPQTNLRIESSYINFAGLLTPDEDAAPEPIGPIDLEPVALQGPITIGTTYFLGMKLDDVNGEYRLANNIVAIPELSGTVDGGRFTAGASLDLGVPGLAYSAQINVDGVALGEALRAFPLDAHAISGFLSGSCRLSGMGSNATDFLHNLGARADLHIVDASMRLLDLFPQLSAFIESYALEQVRFENADMQVRLSNTVAHLSGAFLNPDITLYPEGTIGLDGHLDLVIRLHLSPDIFADGGEFSRYLPQERGRIALPIVVQGTLSEPEVALARDTLGHIIQHALPRLMMDLLREAESEMVGQ